MIYDILTIVRKCSIGGITVGRPKKYTVHLSDEEVKQLKALIKKKDTTVTIRNRCHIMLDMDEEHLPILTQEQCASRRGVTRATIVNTVAAYCNAGLESVLKLKRSINSDNARRKVDGRIEARIIEIACGPAPDGHSRWTIRLLEEQMKVVLDEPISREAIRRTLKKIGLDLTAATTGAFQA